MSGIYSECTNIVRPRKLEQDFMCALAFFLCPKQVHSVLNERRMMGTAKGRKLLFEESANSKSFVVGDMDKSSCSVSVRCWKDS